MAYTTIDDPEAYFQVEAYTGTGSTRTVTLSADTDMQPDVVWIKKRASTYNHNLFDSVRGVNKGMYVNNDAAEHDSNADGYLSAFSSDGFEVRAGSSTSDYVNVSSETYVAWCWKAGGSGGSNSDGAIATTRSVSTTAGISIMKYTGSGSGSNIAHGLGATPEVTIRKNTGGTQDWHLHTSLIDGSHDYFILNTTAAKADSGLTAASSTLVYTAADSATFIVYAFKSIQGFSKFGTLTANGAGGSNPDRDGTFVYCGFSPSLVIYKITDATGNWVMQDTTRDGLNPTQKNIYANATTVEGTSDGRAIDILSNGFKLRGGDFSTNNVIFMAWAEAPFVNSNGVPCNAR
jgi:hypothetical protein